jgi:type IV secretory pathway VirD2 relaxase
MLSVAGATITSRDCLDRSRPSQHRPCSYPHHRARCLDDGRILNIAGDHIAHGIRHRASELVTLELGHQSEMELQTKLRSEVEAERWTRHDKMLQTEQREQGIIDLRPGEGARPILSARTAAS